MTSEEKQKVIPSAPFGAVLAAFDKHGVQYIVIGGQAVIAYGAAQSTHDADFWVNPTKTNLVRIRQALKELKTTLRFLPPLRLSYLKKGHGIHFRFKYDNREFLLATKKTDRERDYPAIQSLAEIVFKQAKRDKTIREVAMSWLIEESRTPRHLQIISREWRGGKKASLSSGRPESPLPVCVRTRTGKRENFFSSELPFTYFSFPDFSFLFPSFGGRAFYLDFIPCPLYA